MTLIRNSSADDLAFDAPVWMQRWASTPVGINRWLSAPSDNEKINHRRNDQAAAHRCPLWNAGSLFRRARNSALRFPPRSGGGNDQ